MRLVIADTGPIHFVVLPIVVLAELSHPLAPASVQRWVAAAPAWLEVAESPAVTLSAGIQMAMPLGSGFRIPLSMLNLTFATRQTIYLRAFQQCCRTYHFCNRWTDFTMLVK